MHTRLRKERADFRTRARNRQKEREHLERPKGESAQKKPQERACVPGTHTPTQTPATRAGTTEQQHGGAGLEPGVPKGRPGTAATRTAE